MKTAEIIYKKNLVVPRVSENHPHPEKYEEDNNELYHKVHMGETPTQVTIDEDWFEDRWAKVSEEEVSSSRTKELEKLWDKYNKYPSNPLSAENGGQHILEENDIDHTSMTIGDVVKVEDRYYIAVQWGFCRLYFN